MMSASTKHKVAIVMGSKSDYATMKNCEKILRLLKVKFETKIVSAHRTPERMFTVSYTHLTLPTTRLV